MYRADIDEFVFTRYADSDALRLRGTSTRYAAIVAIGADRLDIPRQRRVLGGRTGVEFVAMLVDRLPAVTNLGDVALICWAAAQSAPHLLPAALARLRAVDQPGRPRYVVEAAWVVSALAAARPHADVEADLTRARARLLNSKRRHSPLFPHATGPGLVSWYRTHVACYADQVYPIQALALLHASGDDPTALQAADACAQRICRLQGADGQWWWHYDARTGGLVESYPVYTVHQHAMGPMALLDLADAGGQLHLDAIESGLGWLSNPPELRTPDRATRPMLFDEDGVTWRKVYRGDPRKVVRAARALGTRVNSRTRLSTLDRIYRPSAIDRECRPYEFGWLLYAWLERDTSDRHTAGINTHRHNNQG